MVEKGVINEISGKEVRISVFYDGKKYQGIVSSGASYGSDHFIVFEDGTMINIKYIQTIQVIQ